MTLKFCVYAPRRDGSIEHLFAGDIPVSYDAEQPGPKLSLQDLEKMCNDLAHDHQFIPTFRLDLQRIALLASDEVIQYLAAVVMIASNREETPT